MTRLRLAVGTVVLVTLVIPALARLLSFFYRALGFGEASTFVAFVVGYFAAAAVITLACQIAEDL